MDRSEERVMKSKNKKKSAKKKSGKKQHGRTKKGKEPTAAKKKNGTSGTGPRLV